MGVGIVEAGVQKKIAEGLHQVFEAEARGEIAGEFCVADAFHGRLVPEDRMAKRLRMPSLPLVEASTGAVAGGFVAFDLSFAHALGVVGGVVGALLLFGGGEAALFGTAQALVGSHAFKEKFGCAYCDLWFGLAVDLKWREFFKEALNLLQFG